MPQYLVQRPSPSTGTRPHVPSSTSLHLLFSLISSHGPSSAPSPLTSCFLVRQAYPVSCFIFISITPRHIPCAVSFNPTHVPCPQPHPISCFLLRQPLLASCSLPSVSLHPMFPILSASACLRSLAFSFSLLLSFRYNESAV